MGRLINNKQYEDSRGNLHEVSEMSIRYLSNAIGKLEREGDEETAAFLRKELKKREDDLPEYIPSNDF